MTADSSIIFEIFLDQLDHWIYNMRRSSVLYENYHMKIIIQTYTQLKCWNDLVSQKTLLVFATDCTGNETSRTYLPKKQYSYMERCRQPSPHSYLMVLMYERMDFLLLVSGNSEHWKSHKYRNGLCLSTRRPMAIRCLLTYQQDTQKQKCVLLVGQQEASPEHE